MTSPALTIKFSHVTNADGFDARQKAEPLAVFMTVEDNARPQYHDLTLPALYRELDAAQEELSAPQTNSAGPLSAAGARHVQTLRTAALITALQEARPLLEDAVRRWQHNMGVWEISEEGSGRPSVARPLGPQIRPR